MTRPKVRDLWNSRDERWDWPLGALEVIEQHGEQPEWLAVLSGELVLRRRSSGFHLAGELAGTLHYQCDFCACPVEEPMELELDETFVLERFLEGAFEKEVELSDDDFYEPLHIDGVFDLVEMLRQVIQVELGFSLECETPECIENRPETQVVLMDGEPQGVEEPLEGD